MCMCVYVRAHTQSISEPHTITWMQSKKTLAVEGGNKKTD